MEINSPEELYDLVSQTEYGWLDSDGQKHYKLEMEKYQEKYILQTPEEVEKNKIGICWDQVELERYYLERMGIKCESYIIYYAGKRKDRVHTFLTYNKDNYTYWFEHAWKNHKGIHKYKNNEEILADVKRIFIDEKINNNYEEKRLHIYNYAKPKPHVNHYNFLKYCQKFRDMD